MNGIVRAACVAIALSSFAAVADDLEIATEIHEIETYTDDEGVVRKRAITPDGIVPGDTVRYRIRILNKGVADADDIVINNPVPEHTAYVGGTAFGTGTDITYSIDGNDFAAFEALRVSEAGDTRPAAAADIRHIRWTFRQPLPIGAETFVSFQVTVD
jgi:uncharacterized repeat protein (TIGR01451 family)